MLGKQPGHPLLAWSGGAWPLHLGQGAVPASVSVRPRLGDGQGSCRGTGPAPTHHPLSCHLGFELQPPQPPESLLLARSLSSALLLPGCHKCRDAVYTSTTCCHCGNGRDARQAGTWVRQETRDWVGLGPIEPFQRLGWGACRGAPIPPQT